MQVINSKIQDVFLFIFLFFARSYSLIEAHKVNLTFFFTMSQSAFYK